MNCPKYPKIVHISYGGPEYLIKTTRGVILFEMHPYHGPILLDRRTGSGSAKEFPKWFWPLFERWQSGGQKCDESRVCIVPPPAPVCKSCGGTGCETEHMGGRHYKVIGKCKQCEESKVAK